MSVFIPLRLKLILKVLVGTTLLAVSQNAVAFSCYEPSFVQLLDDSPVIFVAKITGSVIANSTAGEAEVNATFEVLENLKGTIDFDHLTTTLDYGGIPFVIGGEYLVYAQDNGRTGMCSDSRTLAPEEIVTRPTRAKYELDALRVLAKDNFRNVREPWVMYKLDNEGGDATCIIRHRLQFEGESDSTEFPHGLIAAYRYGGPVKRSDALYRLPSIFNIGLGWGGSVEGHTATMRIGSRIFRLPAGKMPDERPPQHFDLSASDIQPVLDLLGSESDIVIEVDHPKFGKIFAKASPPTMSSALEDFDSCLERDQ